MTNSEWLILATNELEQSGIETARLDCLVLLENVLGIDRAQLLAYPDSEMLSKDVTELAKSLNRRTTHEPLAYILGTSEFYGRDFVVSPAVLVPRPESETMIELLKELANGLDPSLRRDDKKALQDGQVRVADVGTGSGALGITAMLELPNLQVELLDIDEDALKIAQINVDKYTIGVSTIKSDLLSNTTIKYDILLCNLPYVPDDYQINRAASIEPALALFGGPDGLDLYRTLFQQTADMASRPLYILTESLPGQHSELASIASQTGYKQLRSDNFVQVFERIS